MAKLRALKTAEEIKAVPVDQPVLIELPGAATNTEGASGEVAGAVEPKPQVQQDPAKSLQGQLEAMKEANKLRDAREAQLTRERNEAIEAARVARESQTGTEQQLATTGLARAQADMTAAKQAYKVASESGDFGAAADAQEKIGRASAMILHYEQVAAEPKPVQQTQQVSTDPMQAIEQSPTLYPKEKSWFREHPEAWTDRRMNIRLEDGYNRAVERGLIRGTDQYFQFLDEHMGYKKPTQDEDQTDYQDGGSVMVGAPVSRETTNMNGSPSKPGQVILSADERELCANMGISEITYAQNKVRMQADKKENPEKYFTNGR